MRPSRARISSPLPSCRLYCRSRTGPRRDSSPMPILRSRRSASIRHSAELERDAMKKFIGVGLILWLTWFGSTSVAADADRPPITVFAAASLTNVLQELGDGFTKDTSIPVRFSFAASSALARQIENGAPADVFFSADLEWMDYLQARNLLQTDTRRDMLGNRLGLVASKGSLIKLKIAPHFPPVAA